MGALPTPLMHTPKGVHMGTLRVPINGCPYGHPYGWPIGHPLEPVTSRRRVDERPKEKENKSRPIMGTQRVPIWGGCPTHPINAPLRGCIWGQGPKGPPCPHYRATEGGPLKIKMLCYCGGVHNEHGYPSWQFRRNHSRSRSKYAAMFPSLLPPPTYVSPASNS